MALLHTGKVLYYSGFRYAEARKTETRLWYPETGEIKAPPTPADLFCAGHSFLPDGRLLSTGGTLEYRKMPPTPPAWIVRIPNPLAPFIVRAFGRFFPVPELTGPTDMYLFDPVTEQWKFAGDMVEGRWYPTNTTLPDGRILILSGSDAGGGFRNDGKVNTNLRMEVYDAEKGLTLVGTIPAMEPSNHDGQRHHGFPSLYPRIHVLPLADTERASYPAGKAFCSGYGPETKMLNLHTWEWAEVGMLNFGTRHDGCSVLLPLKPPDYHAKVLTFGGSEKTVLEARGTETAEMMDFGKTPHKWEQCMPMQGKRVNASAVIMPDGKVLVVGGNSTGRFHDPVHDVEVFDPVTAAWSSVAKIKVPRGYHSTAILLPDGRVLASGTTPYGRHELRMEVYKPNYLFKGERPKIEAIPETISYAQSFEVTYAYARTINGVALIRPGATTHAFDMDQRYVALTFNRASAGLLTVQAPKDQYLAPPGYYMLFLLSEDGVPSEARFVHLRR